jgi:hypothetical protein
LEQTQWLRRHAQQSASAGTTRVFVVTTGDESVVAYYAWCMAQLDIAASPTRLHKGARRYPQPVALLARLGVDTEHENNGLGAALLVDAITRLIVLSGNIECRGLLIQAESDEARTSIFI